jgi:hypothetical protein
MAARCAVSLSRTPAHQRTPKDKKIQNASRYKGFLLFFLVLSAPSCLLHRVNKAGVIKYAV